MPANYFKDGGWNVICDVCGFKFKNHQLKKRWDGLMVCKEDYELDHPQKYLRVHETGEAVPWVREEPAPVFQTVCYIYAIPAYADLAEADCAQADKATPSYSFLLALKLAGTTV
jgi:hypothetical protein